MIGFKAVLSSKGNKSSDVSFDSTYFSDGIFSIIRSEKIKFYDDSLFFIRDKKLFVIHGAITNSSELREQYNAVNFEETFYQLYEKEKSNSINLLRGTFCGLIYCLDTHKIVSFVDHFRTKNIYYTKFKGDFHLSTDLSVLARICQERNRLNKMAAYRLLSFGATLERLTLFEDIFKIQYASVLEYSYKNDELKEEDYFSIKIIETDSDKKEEDYIRELDHLFKKAVDRQFSKDKEYNYKHIVGLSAGRDSRMTAWVSNDLGYKEDVVNFTFSETGELDEVIPKQIARKLKNKWLFRSLDNGVCLKDFHLVNETVCGEVTLQTVLHGDVFLRDFNFEDYGLIHNGMLGDVIVGSFGSNQKLTNTFVPEKFVYSRKLINKAIEKDKVFSDGFQTEQEFNYVYRGIGVTLQSNIYVNRFAETLSPFMDLDFFNYSIRIPYAMRSNLLFYDKWMLDNYREATMYSHNGRRIGEKVYKVRNREFSLGELPSKILNALKRRLNVQSKKGMNPLSEWYYSNNALKLKLDDFFQTNIDLVVDNELKEDALMLYKTGSVSEKMQVITLLSTLELFFKK